MDFQNKTLHPLVLITAALTEKFCYDNDSDQVHHLIVPVIMARNRFCTDFWEKRMVDGSAYRNSRYFLSSRSRSSARRILPEWVLGSSATNSIARGYLYGAVVFFT